MPLFRLKRRWTRIGALLPAALLVAALSACGSSGGSGDSGNSGNSGGHAASPSASGSASEAPGASPSAAAGGDAGAKIVIVAAENFYGEAAAAVGGDYVQVTSLLTSPDADPHDYEPTPDAAKAVDGARIVIFNGIGYDEWAQKLIDASSDAADKTAIRVASDVMGHRDGDNEHVWYDPETMPKFADVLAERLGELDPAHKEDFAKQAEAYKQTLSPFTDAVAALKQASPLPIAVSEPVFDYMAQALNLEVTDEKFELAAEEETDPAPADIAELQDAIKDGKIAFFVNNIQASSQTVQNIVELANQSGIPVVGVTETMPAGKTYVQWMTDQLNEIQEALK